MINKKIIYSLPVIVALAFQGCGSSDATTSGASEQHNVVVERGAVYDSNVTDAEGNVALQVDDTNVYMFAKLPVYPVSANGGWIDVDGDGELTEADVELDIELVSWTNNITPTTTFIADTNETIREERLFALADETNSTVDELLEVPSKATKNSIIVLNAVYEKLVERDNEHSNAPIAIARILERYAEIDNNANLDENATSAEMAIKVEEQTMFNLKAKGLIKKLYADDIKKIKEKKEKKEKAPKGDDESEEENEEESESNGKPVKPTNENKPTFM